MAPEGEQPVIKMKQYSREFNAGQIGMVLVHANVSGDVTDNDPTNDDPAQNLKIIDGLERNLNTVENASAVSVVFLMKATGLLLLSLVNRSLHKFKRFLAMKFCQRMFETPSKSCLIKKLHKVQHFGIC